MTGSAHAIWFPDWPAKLQEVRLPVAIRQRYKLAIIRYLQFCKQSHQPATVESARQFMQQTEDARQLGQQPLEHWNEALRWFFKEGESQPVALDRPASRPENADGAPGGRALPTTDGARGGPTLPATLAIKCVAGLAEGSGRGSEAGFSIRKSTPSAKPSLSPVKQMSSALLK
jgi:hypothetical protein